MRPVPGRKHHWAVLVLLAVVAVNGWATFQHSALTGEQMNLMAEAYKGNDPSLFAHDGLFADAGPGAPWRLHTPAWQALERQALRWSRDEPLNAFRILAGITLLLYLLAMYVLLYRQTHSTSAATFVAVLSMAVFSVRRAYWGAGALEAVGPETLFLAAAPLLAQGFLRLRQRASVLGVFFLSGLCANLDLSSAVNFVAVLLVAFVGLGGFRWRSFLAGAGCAAAAGLGACPALYHYYVVIHSAGPQAASVLPGVLWEGLKASTSNVLYPQVVGEGARWLPVAVLLALAPAAILSRAGRYRLQDLGGWLWLLGASAVVAFGLLGAAQLIARALGTVPTTLELFDALRLGMLPLYVLFAQSMVHLVRLSKTHRAWVKAALGVFMAAYLGSSYNTRPIRHLVQDSISALGQPEHPRQDRRRQERERRAIGLWAREQTSADALFVTPHEEIRLYGRRSLVAAPADFPYLFHLAPGRLGDWLGRLKQQRELLAPPESTRAKPDNITAFVDIYWKQKGAPLAPTYLVIGAASAPSPGGRLVEVTPPQGQWGEHWRVFRLLPHAPTTTAAATQVDRPTPPA